MHLVADLVRAMEELAPSRLAAPWDNVGLLVGDPAAPLGRALLAIDCTRPVLTEAVRRGCEAVVSYHPPIFEAQKRILAGSVAHDAARAGLAIHSPHTALDAAPGGTNDVLADALAMRDRAPLQGEGAPSGFGRVGPVPTEPLHAVVARLKAALGVRHVLVAGPLDRLVKRAAVCAGSGGEFVDAAVAAGADVLVTGELRHHDTLRAVAAGMGVVCTLHSVSERAALVPLASSLRARLPGVEILASVEDREPLDFA